MHNLVANTIPIEPAQAEQLRALFTSPGFSILREIIVAHCARHQVDWMNASLYDTDAAELKQTTSKIEATRFNAALDVLDHLMGSEQEWFRTQLDQRR